MTTLPTFLPLLLVLLYPHHHQNCVVRRSGVIMSPALVLSHALPKSDWIMIGGRLILNGKINY